jgi:hypothetical protein
MLEEKIFFAQRFKAEAPLYTLFILAGFIGFMALYSMGFIAIVALWVVLITLFWVLKSKLSGNYYIKLNHEGLQYRLNIFEKGVFVPWKSVDQVNFHLYEINLRIRDSKMVVNLPTNYFPENDIPELTENIKMYFSEMGKSN